MKRRSFCLGLLLVPALTVAGVSAHPGHSHPTSGIRGVAQAGPISPVERPGEPNTRPLPGAIITVQPKEGGDEIARVRADRFGRFRLPLPPGTYLLVPLPPDPDSAFPYAGSETVVVKRRKFTQLTIEYDTGIR
jgi:hypothetical protein